jgi:hypothetical protein
MSDLHTVKTETFDVAAMESLWRTRKTLPADIVKQLDKYYKRRRGNTVQVVYMEGKLASQEHMLGRLYPEGGIGYTCFQSDIRNFLAAPHYWDVDVVNAHPTLLLQLATKNGWAAPVLSSYVNNREARLTEVMEALHVSRNEAKTAYIEILYGSFQYERSDIATLRNLTAEMGQLTKNLCAAFPDFHKKCQKNKKPTRTSVAYIMQSEEFRVLRALDHALQAQGRSLDTYIHDGGLVRKLEGEQEMPAEVLQRCEASILA